MTTCTIKGMYRDSANLSVSGEVRFTPSPVTLLNIDEGTIMVPTPLTATLGVDGSFSIDVQATDDPNVTPQDWTYTVEEDFAGGRTYAISAPGGTTVNLADVAPVPTSNGDEIVVGPQGPQGPKGDKGDSGVGVHEHIDATVNAHDASAIAYTGEYSEWIGADVGAALDTLDEKVDYAEYLAWYAVQEMNDVHYYFPNVNTVDRNSTVFIKGPGTDPDSTGTGTPTFRGAPFEDFYGIIVTVQDSMNAWSDWNETERFAQHATYTGTTYKGPLRRAVRYGTRAHDWESPLVTWEPWQGYADDDTAA